MKTRVFLKYFFRGCRSSTRPFVNVKSFKYSLISQSLSHSLTQMLGFQTQSSVINDPLQGKLRFHENKTPIDSTKYFKNTQILRIRINESERKDK